MIKELHLNPILTDEETENLRGTYLDNSHFDFLIDEDTDVYDKETGNLLLKFRKKRFNETLCDLGFSGFKDLAKASRGRGASAGPIDPNSVYWKKRKLVKVNKWSANYEVNGKVSKMKVNNEVASNPIGFYGSTKNLGVNLPCRLSHYTRTNFYKYREGLPFIKEIAKSYEELNPEEFTKQMERANSKPDFKIEDTPFSTITINRNFRTAVHTDKGDWGFGNLSVLERGKYQGGYLVFPKWKIAINMRSGDHLCADVHQYHGNTEMYESEEDKLYNDQLEDIFKDNLEVGVLGLNNRFCRLSFVCYLRENIINCSAIEPEYMTPDLSDKTIKTFYINLRNASGRRKKFENTKFFRWEAITREEVSQEFKERMVSYWNVPESQHLAKCACYQSHLSLLQEIVKHQLNNVLILEDDAVQIDKIPTISKYNQDGITYLGGFFGNKKITSKEPIDIKSKRGMNQLDTSKYRIIMAMSYFIPKWELARDLLLTLESRSQRPRAWDIDLFNCLGNVYYHYPAIFVEEQTGLSTIRGNRNQYCDKFYNYNRVKKINNK
jgi:GR25 family glycosyltransferase involved in LPS biosynthesis